MILFNNFKKLHYYIKDEIESAVAAVMNSGWYVLGKELESFELNFAEYLGTKFCVGVASGTEAIALGLMVNGIKQGDEVITTNLTAYPTITGIIQAGATPVVVDISEDDGLIDVTKIEKKITKRTKAIVPVHLYGQCCNLAEIDSIAKRFGLIVIEDCAQSTGATFGNKKCGTIGDCGAFSFYPTKNLGCYGDGGAVTTNNKTLFNKLLSYRNYGQTKRYYHETKGINSRLDEIQAAILNVKLKYLDEWNFTRNKIASFYKANLNGVKFLTEHKYGNSVNHLFVIKADNRYKLLNHLEVNGVQTLIHYPIPINKQAAFYWQKTEIMNNSEHFAKSILSLPIHPYLTQKEIDKVVKTVNEFK